MMQIASTCKDCTCDKCKPSKEKNSLDTRLNNGKCTNGQPSRQRTLTRSRPTKTKARYTYGNHHRLDHTYAANINDVSRTKALDQPTTKNSMKDANNYSSGLREDKQSVTTNIELNSNGIESSDEVIIVDSNDDISVKSTWLRNLCLEYQPSRNNVSQCCSNDALREKQPRFHFTGINGTLKQYHRNRKVNKNKTEFASTFIGKGKIVKSVQEDKRRWIAAQALIELAQSK